MLWALTLLWCSVVFLFPTCKISLHLLSIFYLLACFTEEPPPRPPQPSLLVKSKCGPSVQFTPSTPPQNYCTSVLYAFFFFALFLPLLLSLLLQLFSSYLFVVYMLWSHVLIWLMVNIWSHNLFFTKIMLVTELVLNGDLQIEMLEIRIKNCEITLV